ncbi:MAG: RHS repeat-associated core domain-containing protein, partial [bacterium]|nr:RHS repeat-associated core domain-containing protein [bacterium]
HSDHLHSATILTDAAGAELRRLAYRAFGEDAENIGSGSEPKYSYTGKERDSSGLMYYGARYYDPALSRFITADTIYDRGPQGLNRYSYALNNPILYRDPSGHGVVDDFLYSGWAGNVADKVDAGAAFMKEVNLSLGDDDEVLSTAAYNSVIDLGASMISGALRTGEGTGEYIDDPTNPNKFPVLGTAGERLGTGWGEAISDPSVETVSKAVAATAEAIAIAIGGVVGARAMGVKGTKGNPKVSTSNSTSSINQSPSVEVDRYGNVISREPRSIQDQMTLDAAKQGEGRLKIDNLGDPRYSGMQKMELKTTTAGGKKSNVHYVRNPDTGQLMDFKFKKHSTDYIHNYEKTR